MNKDLTVGDPAKVLWKFCLPLFGSIIFQQLYNIADSFVAGKFIGENALAAVGNSYEITLIFIAFAFGCNIGCSVIVSQLFGAKKLGEMKTAVYTTFISSAVVCAALMLAGTLGCDGLLRLINTPENVFADSKLYLDIYILGLPFVFFYNIATGIFSALGDSKTPFVFLACSSVANIRGPARPRSKSKLPNESRTQYPRWTESGTSPVYRLKTKREFSWNSIWEPMSISPPPTSGKR